MTRARAPKKYPYAQIGIAGRTHCGFQMTIVKLGTPEVYICEICKTPATSDGSRATVYSRRTGEIIGETL